MKKITNCRVSGEKLVNSFSLGKLYVSDFIPENSCSHEYQEKIELELAFGPKSGLVQLTESADPEKMYRRYWYRSGTNQTMTTELESITKSILSKIKHFTDDVWLDIGCNDGTLLRFVPKSFTKVGIDPSPENCRFASEHADVLYTDYFSKDVYKITKKAKVITSIAMFYDLENPNKFCKDIYDILEDDGVWVIQMSYLPLMLEQLAFDNICHEHLEYYDLASVKRLLDSNGFIIRDVELNDVNGGSFRIYIQKSISDSSKFGTSPYRDVANFRVRSLLTEESIRYSDINLKLSDFYSKIQFLKAEVTSFIRGEVKKGKKIWAYGASTKGNTLLQYFDLDRTLISGISERQSRKCGLKTIGSEIPIFSEEEARIENPDYMLVLPWHFIKEFKDREKSYLKAGGKFIVPCPNFEIISL